MAFLTAFDILMVIGGYDGQFLDDVELVDLSDAGNSCGKPAPYPFPVADSVGFWFQGCDSIDILGTFPNLPLTV